VFIVFIVLIFGSRLPGSIRFARFSRNIQAGNRSAWHKNHVFLEARRNALDAMRDALCPFTLCHVPFALGP
jgi:hypothetical protein